MTWQKCPICNGSGIVGISATAFCACCNGRRIIHTVTGRPPEGYLFPEDIKIRQQEPPDLRVRHVGVERPNHRDLSQEMFALRGEFEKRIGVHKIEEDEL